MSRAESLGQKTDLRGTWLQAITSIALPVLAVFLVRWILLEPFVIPSGSMLPNLFIHDHIFVNKLSYGIKIPFMDRWILRWAGPKRGEVVVFKFPENPDTYFVKRVIGLPGDRILVSTRGIELNGQMLKHESIGPEEGFDRFYETNPDGTSRYVIQHEKTEDNPGVQEIQVPPGMYFMMGDNRDNSNDSRFWGFVKTDLLVGPAKLIWLSCEQMLESQPHVCDPATIRWKRIGTFL